jgi:acyl dehydratase
MADLAASRGRFFEQYALGDAVTSAGRTVTEADIVHFAGLSGDFNPIHVDAEASRVGVFGRRIAHGLLGLAIASGLLAQLGFMEGAVLAFREMTWKFSLPIFIGDTIHARATVVERKAVQRLGGGLVTFEVEVINQEGRTAQSGKWVVLVGNKPGSDQTQDPSIENR